MDNNFRNKLIPLLTLMKSKAEQKGLSPSLRTNTVIDMLKSTGITLGFSQLQQMLQDPSVKDLVKSVDKDRIELVSSDGDDSTSANGSDDLDLSGLNDMTSIEGQELPQEDGSMGMPNSLDSQAPPDMNAPALQTSADPNNAATADPNAVPAGPTKAQVIDTMAKRALQRTK